jgi:DNA-binding transcriptional MerR regulator
MADRAEPEERTFPVGAVTRLTGLSPDVLRAWERRYGVVEPLRTAGGTRRYRESDVAHLRRVKAAVDAGHRISEVARLDPAELERRLGSRAEPPPDPLRSTLEALERLDGTEAEQLISLQLAALGPVRFARDFALPLMDAIGEGWASRRLCVASEHLGSALVRSLLGSVLRPTSARRGDPQIVFATPPGERHEIGLLAAALTALGAGARPLYLGADLPAEELVRAVETSGAAAVALSVVALPVAEAQRSIATLRRTLPPEAELWVGGSLAEQLALPDGALLVDSLETLEQRVEMLRVRTRAG